MKIKEKSLNQISLHEKKNVSKDMSLVLKHYFKLLYADYYLSYNIIAKYNYLQTSSPLKGMAENLF